MLDGVYALSHFGYSTLPQRALTAKAAVRCLSMPKPRWPAYEFYVPPKAKAKANEMPNNRQPTAKAKVKAKGCQEQGLVPPPAAIAIECIWLPHNGL